MECQLKTTNQGLLLLVEMETLPSLNMAGLKYLGKPHLSGLAIKTISSHLGLNLGCVGKRLEL